MKKFLPKLKTNPLGFTLVELLVVVAIIAVLSVIGITMYTGIQKTARDGRRRADIDAIASALEIAKVGTYYVDLTGAKFAGGTVPTDSGNTNAGSSTNTYCIYSRADNTSITGPTAQWATATCPTVTGATPSSITSTSVDLIVSATNWTVCASLENTSAAYCKSSSQ